MVSKVTEYALFAFFTFVSMIVLYFIYMGLINSQKLVREQVQDEDYKSKCNCFQVAALNDNELILRNIMCDYVENLIVSWSDYEYYHNETIIKNDLIVIQHNSSIKEDYVLYYNDCE
ncbi:MAG: hypothetical protein PHN56_00315 [Candidatus Nanoarchaeia archaeon]|nr:hypothetical protein [Candidatus Nanoarchaeia archaeon]